MKRHRWSEADASFIRVNAHRMSDQEMADTLSRVHGRPFTEKAIERKRWRVMGGSKWKKGRRRKPPGA
jgi:hypothetical protein